MTPFAGAKINHLLRVVFGLCLLLGGLPGIAQAQTVTGTVFRDNNANGAIDLTATNRELGVGGVTVKLLVVTSPVGASAVSTSLVSTTLTDGAGKYLFGSLPAGRYVVEFVKVSLPPTCVISPDFQAAGVPDGLNSDADPATGQSPIITILPTDPTKKDILTVDAGLIVPGCKPVCVPISVVRRR